MKSTYKVLNRKSNDAVNMKLFISSLMQYFSLKELINVSLKTINKNSIIT